MTVFPRPRGCKVWFCAAFACALLAWSPPVCAQDALPTESYVADPGAGARSHNIDQQRMIVDVRFEPEKRRVHGTVTHLFRPLREEIDSLSLDGPGITYEEVRLNGKKVQHQIDAKGITIYPDTPRPWRQTDTLAISYTATPRHALYFTGWDDPTGRARRQIWTQGQGPGHRYWIPLYDAPNDKLVTETIVTFDDDFRVLSNGERVRVERNGDGTRTWHYRISAPHPSYTLMIAIGRYDIQRMTSSGGVEVSNYYYPDQPERAEPTYRYTAQMVDILERETGVDYPWSHYSQIPVHNFLHGGMENTTATIFSDAYYVDERAYLDWNYVTVNAHELAHQWFGDLVTMARSEGIWLHEAFATHYAKVVERALFGENHYQWNRKQERDRALSNIAEGPRPIRHTRSGAGRVYYKGSLVLDMLKDVVGKPEFDRVIRAYLEAYAHENVISRDFFSMFEEVIGRNLDWFFDQWILRGGVPHYDVSYRTADTSGATVTEVTVRQIQDRGPLVGYFKMPITFEVHYEDGSHTRRRAWVDGKKTVVRLAAPADKRIDFALFDPNNQVLKQLTFERSFDELAAQLRKAPNMIDRYDALRALRDTAPRAKREVLTEAFDNEPFPHVRAEIVAQLGSDPASTNLFEQALRDPSSDVRGAALTHISAITDALVDEFEQALSDSSYQNIEVALRRLTAARPSRADQYLEATKSVVGHDYNVRIAWLELKADRKGGKPSEELIRYAGPSYGFRTRLRSFGALKRLGYLDERVAAHLLDAVAHFNRDLRNPATDLLNQWMDDEVKRAVLKQAYDPAQWTERQATRIERRLDEPTE